MVNSNMIDLYLPLKGGIEKAFHKAIPANLWPQVSVHKVTRRELPPMADYVLHVGKDEPQKAQRWMAANLRAHVVCLPEAARWLTDLVRTALADQTPLTLVDATLATSQQVVKAG